MRMVWECATKRRLPTSRVQLITIVFQCKMNQGDDLLFFDEGRWNWTIPEMCVLRRGGLGSEIHGVGGNCGGNSSAQSPTRARAICRFEWQGIGTRSLPPLNGVDLAGKRGLKRWFTLCVSDRPISAQMSVCIGERTVWLCGPCFLPSV